MDAKTFGLDLIHDVDMIFLCHLSCSLYWLYPVHEADNAKDAGAPCARDTEVRAQETLYGHISLEFSCAPSMR